MYRTTIIWEMLGLPLASRPTQCYNVSMRMEDVTLNGRYKLLEQAGSGGMATVYKAQDLMLRRLVAVKMLHESLTGDEDFLRRFQREAHAAANLSHPNIVTVHDIGQDDGPRGYRHYIVMEYVKGQTLKAMIREHMATTGEPLSVDRALNLGIQISAGIGYAHRAGLVHCDVKPQNVLVSPDERVKVADFGIARAMSEASLQRASILWGTPHYFSPEQAAGEPATPASDVYAIGIILFEMLSGRLPFEAETLPALALKHMHEPPPSLTELNPAVPAQLAQIVKKVLSKEPAGRYRTAGQLERILRSYQESSQQETGPIMPLTPAVSEREAPPVPVAERRTEVFRREQQPAQVTERPTQVMTRPQRTAKTQENSYRDPADLYLPVPGEAELDRRLLLLSILAIILMIGLIPLWYMVARAWGVLG